MNQSFPNIEKSAFKPGCYIGYAGGKVYIIRKNGKHWIARNQYDAGDYMRASKLAGMSYMLTLRTKEG